MRQQTKMEQRKRRQFWVEKSFQNRIIWRFVLVVIGSIFFSQIITVGFIKLKEILDPASQNLIYFSNTVETMAFSRVAEILWLPMLLSTLLGILLVLIFGLLYSHRIAGPLFNLKRMMRRVGEGDLKASMKIRKNDEFHDVEEVFNQMVEALHHRVRDIKTALRESSGPGKKKIEQVLKEIQLDR